MVFDSMKKCYIQLRSFNLSLHTYIRAVIHIYKKKFLIVINETSYVEGMPGIPEGSY